MLLSEGYGLKDVQEWLGHSDIKMTANIYGHLDIRRKRYHCQRLRAGAAAFEAVKKTKKRQILSDLTLLLTLTAIFGPSGESRTHGLLKPHSSALPNCATPGQPGRLESALLL